MGKLIAKKYFETTSFKYYRTENHHVFAIYKSDELSFIHYYGDVTKDEQIHIILNDEQKKELFSRVEFKEC